MYISELYLCLSISTNSLFISFKDERHWVISPSLYPPILCRESKGNNSWTFTKQTQTGKWNGFIALNSFPGKVNRLHAYNAILCYLCFYAKTCAIVIF